MGEIWTWYDTCFFFPLPSLFVSFITTFSIDLKIEITVTRSSNLDSLRTCYGNNKQLCKTNLLQSRSKFIIIRLENNRNPEESSWTKIFFSPILIVFFFQVAVIIIIIIILSTAWKFKNETPAIFPPWNNGMRVAFTFCPPRQLKYFFQPGISPPATPWRPFLEAN